MKGKVAIVTGASRGIGKAIAFDLGRAGAHVVVSSRKKETIDEVAAEMKAEGLEATAIVCHVGKIESLATFVEEVVQTCGGIDVLVNNAGTSLSFGPVLETEMWAYDKTFDVNLKGPYELSRLVHPHMKARGGGSIVNISSVEGLTPSPGLGVYSITKAALIMLTKVTAKEWGKDGIRVNAVCPGYVKTQLSQTIMENEQLYNMLMAQQSLKVDGSPDHMAKLVTYLSSEASGFMTGSIITNDGGLTI